MKKNRRLWFKAKNFGWGWYPSTWEGWIVLLVYTLYITITSTTSCSFKSSFEILFATILLIIVCFLKGEKPEWRWGKKLKK
ncbi:MAG: hypothetical protein AAB705_02520 [Patescibacteria group bacterium]